MEKNPFWTRRSKETSNTTFAHFESRTGFSTRRFQFVRFQTLKLRQNHFKLPQTIVSEVTHTESEPTPPLKKQRRLRTRIREAGSTHRNVECAPSECRAARWCTVWSELHFHQQLRCSRISLHLIVRARYRWKTERRVKVVTQRFFWGVLLLFSQANFNLRKISKTHEASSLQTNLVKVVKSTRVSFGHLTSQMCLVNSARTTWRMVSQRGSHKRPSNRMFQKKHHSNPCIIPFNCSVQQANIAWTSSTFSARILGPRVLVQTYSHACGQTQGGINWSYLIMSPEWATEMEIIWICRRWNVTCGKCSVKKGSNKVWRGKKNCQVSWCLVSSRFSCTFPSWETKRVEFWNHIIVEDIAANTAKRVWCERKYINLICRCLRRSFLLQWRGWKLQGGETTAAFYSNVLWSKDEHNTGAL